MYGAHLFLTYINHIQLTSKYQVLEKLIPHKKSAYKNCRKKLLIEVSRFVDPVASPCSACDDLNVESKIVTFYESRKDLIEVIRASSFSSGVSAATDCTMEMRDKPTCDGGYSGSFIFSLCLLRIGSFELNTRGALRSTIRDKAAAVLIYFV
jgi:hypothetical protein